MVSTEFDLYWTYEQNYLQPSYLYRSECEQNYPIQEAYPAYSPQGYNPPGAAAPALASVHSSALASVPAYGGPTHRTHTKFDRRYSMTRPDSGYERRGRSPRA
nr:hypothetical protein [Tanacetum cinerariifolium]